MAENGAQQGGGGSLLAIDESRKSRNNQTN